MYRNYEDPYALEEMLKEAEERLAQDPLNEGLQEDIAELRDRVNFAWQDEEYDNDYDY